MFLAVLAAMAVSSAYVEQAQSSAPPTYLEKNPIMFNDPVKAVQSSPDFNMLQNLAASIKDVSMLFDHNSMYTAFAPRNVAFAKIPRSLLNEMWIPGNKLWPHVFWHHFAKGMFDENKLKGAGTLTMMDGETVQVAVKDGKIFADGVPVVGVLRTPVWVIYVIDSVLIPASARDDFLTRKR